jgi:hypothetical protein
MRHLAPASREFGVGPAFRALSTTVTKRWIAACSTLAEKSAGGTMGRSVEATIMGPVRALALLLMAASLMVPASTACAQGTPPESRPAKKPVKREAAPAGPKRNATEPRTLRISPVEDVIGARPAAAPVPKTIDYTAPSFGRVPLETGVGTFGFETEKRFKSGTFPDGERLLAPEGTKRSGQSYFGLSVTVPNESKNFPLPVLPPPSSPFSR